MPKAMKICKVCGREYEACHTPNPGVWRWRDVACCYEHGLQYLHDVQVARGKIVEDNVEQTQGDSHADVIEKPTTEGVKEDIGINVGNAEPTDDATKETTTKRSRSKKK